MASGPTSGHLRRPLSAGARLGKRRSTFIINIGLLTIYYLADQAVELHVGVGPGRHPNGLPPRLPWQACSVALGFAIKSLSEF